MPIPSHADRWLPKRTAAVLAAVEAAGEPVRKSRLGVAVGSSGASWTPTVTVTGKLVPSGKVEGMPLHRQGYCKAGAPDHTVILPRGWLSRRWSR